MAKKNRVPGTPSMSHPPSNAPKWAVKKGIDAYYFDHY